MRAGKSSAAQSTGDSAASGTDLTELPASYSTQEASKLLAISVQTVQRWMDLGHLSGWRTPGGHRRIDPQSVQRLLRVASSAGAPPRPGQEREGHVVMLVDDSAEDLEFLAAVAQMVLPGARVISVTSGFAAMMAIGRALPDVLITDIAMPGFDGLEMLRTLRGDPSTANLPVIAVSGYTPEEIDRRFGALPEGTHLMRKPVSPKLLREKLNHMAPHLLQAVTLG